MAKKMVIQSVCDLCQSSEAAGTFRFGWDLVNYEIDLCQQHAEELSEVMERTVSSARRLGTAARSVQVELPPPHPREMVTSLEVRAWAKENGFTVSERGRVPDELFEKYVEAKRKAARSS
jgi:hypothetical protein